MGIAEFGTDVHTARVARPFAADIAGAVSERVRVGRRIIDIGRWREYPDFVTPGRAGANGADR